MGEFAIGQSVPRFEDPRLVRGAGRYVDDVQLPGMTYGVVLRSPHGHAKINSIDTGSAKVAPGVLAIITADDWKAAGLGDLPTHAGLKRRDGSPMYKPRYTVLAEQRTRWIGDPVVFIVAETPDQALDAAELVQIDYEEIPAVISTGDAVKSGSPRVYDDCPDNTSFVELIGDKAACDAGFAKAAHVVKHRFVINRVTAACMEPRGTIGHFDAGNGRYTVYTPTQRPHGFRAELAGILKVPENAVHVITGDTGGSFGMKTPVFNETPLACYASKLTGRPVKWMSTRTEAFLSDAQARDNVTDAELALDKDGNFLALRVTTLAAVGAYLQNNMPAFFLNAGTLAGTYRTPAIFVDASGVFTNTNPMRPYRGNGRPEAAFVIERMVEVAARELKIDSVELRRRNYVSPKEMPFKTGLTFTYDSGEFEKNMDLAIEMAEFDGFAKRRKEARKRGKLRGIGLSNTIERAAAPGTEGAEVRFDKSGSVTLFAGSNSQGQGHETVFKQIVADKLGIHPDEMHYVQGDTDQVFYGEGTGGSRSATMGEIAADAQSPAKIPAGMEPALAATAVHKTPVNNYPNGCHICEVEIDLETGAAELVRYNVVDDVGTVLNPLLLHGQIHGGVAQGVGQVLMEDIRFDSTGQLVTASFMDYAMPRAHDLCAIHVESNPVPTKTNPLGTKGAGEAGCVGALPAVTNALVNALEEFGVRHIEMPATPERLWQIIHGAR